MLLPERQLPRAIARLSPPLITLAMLEAALRFHSFAGSHYRGSVAIMGALALAGLAIHVNLITREPRRTVFVAYALMHAPMLYQAWLLCTLLMMPPRL